MRTTGTAVTRTIVAPVGGWDAREALADMPPENAVQLDNWFPGTDKVTVRPGYATFATGLGAPVESLMSYTPLTGAGRMFAAAGSNIYEVTTGGAVGAAAVSSLTNARWQSVQIGTAGGQFLFAVNEADTPRVFDGSSWANTTVTGPTVANLAWCNLHNRRLWFGEKDSLTAWYLPVNTIGGAAASFSLAAVARLGGYIMAMGTWSRDGGSGAADMAVFLTSEGEAIVYAGTDPTTAADWSLQSVFRIGRPVGRRCMIKSASDLVMVTQDGFVAASTILPVDRAQADAVALSAQINRAVNTAVVANGGRFGWQPFIYPRGTMLMVNVPQSDVSAHQYVFNTLTGKPCRFTGVPALCWGLLGDLPYFGTASGTVCRFDSGNSDDGQPITATALQAYNYFGQVGRVKAFRHIEPIFEGLSNPNASVDLAIDFRLPPSLAAPVPSRGNTLVATWGAARWGVSTWGGATEIWDGWRGARGVGRAAAPRVVVSSATSRTAWIATNISMTPGGQF